MANPSISLSLPAPDHPKAEVPSTGDPDGVHHARIPHFVDWIISSPEQASSLHTVSNFKFFLYPFLKANTTVPAPTTHEEVAAEHEWFKTILSGKLDVEFVKGMDTTWKERARIMKDAITKTFALIITELYWKEIDRRVGRPKPWYRLRHRSCQPASRATDWLKVGDNYGEELRVLQECFWLAEGNSIWRDLCVGIHVLCGMIGVPGAICADPYVSVNAIQHYYVYQESNRQYNHLLEKFGAQKKVLTSLSYRHVLEHLAPSPTNKNSQSWRDFWDAAFETAIPSTVKKGGEIKYDISKMDPSHHLAPVFQAVPGTAPKVIRQHGEILYNTLSANIHGHSGDMIVENSRWGAIEKAILEALRPTETLPNSKEIDWEAERKKYY